MPFSFQNIVPRRFFVFASGKPSGPQLSCWPFYGIFLTLRQKWWPKLPHQLHQQKGSMAVTWGWGYSSVVEYCLACIRPWVLVLVFKSEHYWALSESHARLVSLPCLPSVHKSLHSFIFYSSRVSLYKCKLVWIDIRWLDFLCLSHKGSCCTLYTLSCALVTFCLFFFFFGGTGFELRTSHLLGRYS
jgi:hypothetical protein